MSLITDNLLASLGVLLASGKEIPATDLRAFEAQIIAAIAVLEARARGNTIHYTQGVPANDLGLEGDLGVDEVSGDFFRYTDGAFHFLFNGQGKAGVFVPVAANEIIAGQPAFSTEREWLIWLTQRSNTAVVTPPTATAPGVVRSLAAQPGTAQVVLTWLAPLSNGGATISSYTVKYRPVGASSWSVFGTTANLTATVTGLTGGQQYEFTVLATNSAGTGAAATAITATPTAGTATPLSAPTGLAVANLTNNAISLSAGAVTHATGYVFQLATNPGFTTGLVTSAVQSTPAYSFTGLLGATNYYVRVAAGGDGVSYTTSPFSAALPITTAANANTGKKGTLVLLGNSLFAGVTDTTPTNSGTTAQMNVGAELARLLPTSVELHNEAIAGQTLQQIIDRVSTQLDAHYDPTPGVINAFILLEGTNYFDDPNSTGDQYSLDVRQFVVAQQAKGWKAGVATTPPVDVAHNYKNAKAIRGNSGILAETVYDDQVDFGLNAKTGRFPSADGTVLGSADNTTLFFDGVHWTYVPIRAAAQMCYDSAMKMIFNVVPKPDPAGYPLDVALTGTAIPWVNGNAAAFDADGSVYQDTATSEFSAYAYSPTPITEGEGLRESVAFTVAHYTNNFFALATSATGNYNQYRFAWYGTTNLWEGGVVPGVSTGLADGDRCGFKVWGTLAAGAPTGTPENCVEYYRNGQLIRTTPLAPGFASLTIVANVGAIDFAPQNKYLQCRQG